MDCDWDWDCGFRVYVVQNVQQGLVRQRSVCVILCVDGSCLRYMGRKTVQRKGVDVQGAGGGRRARLYVYVRAVWVLWGWGDTAI